MKVELGGEAVVVATAGSRQCVAGVGVDRSRRSRVDARGLRLGWNAGHRLTPTKRRQNIVIDVESYCREVEAYLAAKATVT